MGNFFAALGFPDSSVGTESTCNALESESEVAQSCLTLGDPMDCSLPGSSVHGIFQARVRSGLPFPSPGDLPNPGIGPGSPAVQADALPPKPQFNSWLGKICWRKESLPTSTRAFLVAQLVKNPPAVWETWVQSLGWKDPLEKEIATHSNTLAWKIPWTEEPGRLQSMGLQRVRHD